MKKPSERVLKILAGMSVEDKITQISCIVPMLAMQNGEVVDEKLKGAIPNGIGRMTQYATGFMNGPKSAAEGHNKIQKHAMETCGVPVIIQNETAAGLVAAGATVFPVPIAIASTWESELAEEMGEVISEEAKAIGARVCMSPVADVARDSRWGRVGETFGEDPLLVARFTAEKAKGIQGDDYRERCVSLAKHFMGYGVSDNGINCATINIGRKELFEVYGTPFAAAIKEADMQGVMVTYSEIDGQPMSVNEYYMNQVLVEDMGFTGLAVCDGMSIPRVIETQGITASREDLAGRALKSRIDADTPFTSVYNHIKEGLAQGLVDIKDLDGAVLRTLTQKEELGLLDNCLVDPEEAERVFAKPGADELSRRMSEKEITLLKNEGGVLPIKAGTGAVAMIGPFADRLSSMFGGYAYPSMIESFVAIALNQGGKAMEGFAEFIEKFIDLDMMKKAMQLDMSKPYQENIDNFLRRTYAIKTLREAFAEELPGTKVLSHKGVSNSDDWQNEIEEAVATAKQSDVVVLALGEVTGFGGDATSGEGVNNPDLTLPGHQQALLEAVSALGKPVVLVLFNGRPLALGDAAPLCDAILEVWYPGPYGGEAVAQALTGKINPGGRLPVTFPQISAQCPIYYGHKGGSGYMTIKQTPDKTVLQPLFPFGHGLSYTTFEVGGLKVGESVNAGDSFAVEATVKNTGDVAGDHVVQIYTRTVQPTVARPVKELRGFKRVSLQPGESATLRFTLDTRQFGYYNKDDKFVIEPSPVDVMLCENSSEVIEQAQINITGDVKEILHDRVFGFGVERL